MHSSLRKELYGTSKFLRPIRTRPAPRSLTTLRRFSSKPRLFSQPGSRNHGVEPTSDRSSISDSSKDGQSIPNAPVPDFDVDLFEKYIQHLSNEGRVLHVCDALSEKDENGKRTIFPHVRKELEKINQPIPHDETALQVANLKLAAACVTGFNRNNLEQGGPLRQDSTVSANNSLSQPSDTGVEVIYENLRSAGVVAPNASHNNGQEQVQGQQQQAKSEAITDNGESLVSATDQTLISRFHGSPAARRQRERQSRLRDRPLTVMLPDWFYERNVSLWKDGQLDFLEGENIQPTGTPHASMTKPSESQQSSAPSASGEVTHLNQVEERIDTVEPGNGKPENNDGNPTATGSSAIPGDDSSALFALKGSGRRYYIQGAQMTELVLTAQGRLKLPSNTSAYKQNTGIRSHILVHYTAQDGDIFLDKLIGNVAFQLQTNLIALDAQDISALITRADPDQLMTDEARRLSYDIYGDIYGEQPSSDDDFAAMMQEDAEDVDEGNNPMGRSGVPFIVGKPIAIDLRAIMKSQFSPRGSRRDTVFLPKERTPEYLSTKRPTSIFQSLIELLLSAPSRQQRESTDESLPQTKDESLPDTMSSESVPAPATIVHVKDLKAIQETNIGKAFLYELYDQVNARRRRGEEIMIIGTSCDRENAKYDIDHIRDLHVSEPDEISSTIIVTPAYPRRGSETDTETGLRNTIQRKVIPRQDREKRLQIINARHLYEMLNTKDVRLQSLKNGFWTKDLAEQFDEADRTCLSQTYWTFAYVQRLAAILASPESTSLSRSIAQAVSILNHSDQLKFRWAKQTQHEKSAKDKKAGNLDEPENEKLAKIRSKANAHEKKLLSGVVEPKKIQTTFQDIHIPAETVEALQTLTTLSLVRPDAFKYGVLASDRIPGLLLYGPPGTGKTLAAKAVARESGATMLEVSAADINDMYVGEGEKNVKALFSLARKLSPCVVFLDEADAMFSARSNRSRRSSHRETLNQFLKEWDGMSNDSGSAFIMVATNRPMDLDDAVLRRLPRRLLVDLPTEKDRLEILKIHLRHENLADDVDLAKLASQTQFYSGSDLKNVAVAAALNCVREENTQAKAHTGSEPYQYPEKRILTAVHFVKALEEISASISEDMSSLREIKKFDEQYGDRRGRKRRSPKWGFKSAAEADSVLDTVKVRS